MSEEKRAEVTRILETARIAFKTRYIGETTRDGNWQCDEWRVSFASFETTREQHFEYFTGLGHREKPKGHMLRLLRDKYGNHAERSSEWARECKPKAPHAADVLYCLILDSRAAEQTFAEWCSEYGYDTDSRKALSTYEACQQNADKLRKVFTRAQIEELRTVLEDY